eukprot:tig00021257_g19756.t1
MSLSEQGGGDQLQQVPGAHSASLELLPADVLARIIEIAYADPLEALPFLPRGRPGLPFVPAVRAALPLVVWRRASLPAGFQAFEHVSRLVRVGLVRAARRLEVRVASGGDPLAAAEAARRLATRHLTEAELSVSAELLDCLGSGPLAALCEALAPSANLASLRLSCGSLRQRRRLDWRPRDARALLSPFPALRRLHLSDLRPSPRAAAGIAAGAPRLAELVVDFYGEPDAPLDSSSAAAFGTLPELTSLTLRGAPVSPDVIPPFRRLTDLSVDELSRTAAAAAARVPSLRRLSAALPHPEALPNLRPLSLTELELAGTPPEALSGLPAFLAGPSACTLRVLGLPRFEPVPALPDAAAAALASLSSLEELRAGLLTPAAAGALAGLPRLRLLHAHVSDPAALFPLVMAPPPSLAEAELRLRGGQRACALLSAAAGPLAAAPALRRATVALLGPAALDPSPDSALELVEAAARLLRAAARPGLSSTVHLAAAHPLSGQLVEWPPAARAALEGLEPRLAAHWPSLSFPGCPSPCAACLAPPRT